jgi:hypothetical protein
MIYITKYLHEISAIDHQYSGYRLGNQKNRQVSRIIIDEYEESFRPNPSRLRNN